MRDKILSPDRAAMVVGIMDGYTIDIAKILAREIRGLAVSTDANLAFPYLLMHICFDEG